MKLIDKFVLGRDYRWSVAFAKSDWKSLVMWRGKKIKNPPNHFLADPFVIDAGDESYCFVEDYDYKTALGCIAAYELSDDGARRVGEAIAEPFHMSFPYVFKYDFQDLHVPRNRQKQRHPAL